MGSHASLPAWPNLHHPQNLEPERGMRVRGLITALLCTTATAATAQTAGSYEISGFSRYTRFDNTLSLDNGFGGGGSLGFFLLRNLALDAEGAYTYRTPTTDGLGNLVTNLALRGRLSYHVPLAGNATSIRFGAGYVRNLYRKDASFDDDGVTGIFGLRLGVTPAVGIRMDWTADYFRSPDAGRAKYVNWGGQLGLSFVLGNSRTSSSSYSNNDKDHDGVQDDFDRCPKTPAGMNVDAAGCAPSQLDSDHDRVNDEADRCPNTPPAASVDADGCSSIQKDADQDGVLDTMDRCPRTAAGERVNPDGCADNQRDDDADGVLNNADRCPATRAGEQVDASGCAAFVAAGTQDSDRDGVIDTIDQCPNTPMGEIVNPRGCTRDTDGDGVPDSRDHCRTPLGEKIDENGCPALFKVGAQDSDNDGVADATDQCPNTPVGEAVNPRGCTRDTDGDGVPDGRDQCGSTPAGEKIDENGCPTLFKVGSQDSDKDGVADTTDQCPNTPVGEAVNSRGCPRDTDGDGVPDGRDQCGSTPVGEKIDENGCPILFKKGARSVVLRGVTFQTGRAMLTPEGRDVLRDIASQLVENPEYRIQISGHTDNTGTRAANLRLSLARARTVETFLEANGVPPMQLTAKGFGPDVPIAPNTTAGGRARNRRVELNRTN
jgi:outer membrane protein OmpA-like peptidoglycan-associated protein